MKLCRSAVVAVWFWILMMIQADTGSLFNGDTRMPASGRLPQLVANGTYYQVGFQTGQTFSQFIQTYYAEHPALRPIWLPWSQTPQGQKAVRELLTGARKFYPQYVTELTGMADGAKVSFIEMFLANHAVEIAALLSNSSYREPDSCSDILVNRPQTVLLGHNEDNTPLIQNKSYLLTATVTQAGKVLEHFTAYCYPGQLAGNAFGFNHHGLIMSMNGLYPKYVRTNGVGRGFINRAMLASDSIKGAVDMAHTPAAYGFSCNVGMLSKDTPQLCNIETAPDPSNIGAIVSVHQVLPSSDQRVTARQPPGDDNVLFLLPSGEHMPSGYYFHVNMYRRLNVSQIPERIISSTHRTYQIERYPDPGSSEDVLRILGDTTDTLFPIYRSPRPTDNETTLATALFDLRACTLAIYTDNPRTSRGPQLVLPLTC